MGKFHGSIKVAHKQFTEKQHIFFVGSAPLSAGGHINLSPKGLDCFRVLSKNKVAYMDLISSGNETSAHTLENGRITIMFCSFEDRQIFYAYTEKDLRCYRIVNIGKNILHSLKYTRAQGKLLLLISTGCKHRVALVCRYLIMEEKGIFILSGLKKKAKMDCLIM
jgi:hypothetical protein